MHKKTADNGKQDDEDFGYRL